MRKFLYSFIALAGILSFASCQKDALTVYNPADATKPSLGQPAGGALSMDGSAITLSFTEVDFGLTAATVYNLYTSLSSDMADAQRLSATITTGETCTATFTQPALNSAILNMGGVAETTVTVYFRLEAGMANQQGGLISGTELYSETVSAEYTPYNADLLDSDIYSYIYVIGSYNGWSFDNCTQYLYNYNGDGATYEGTIDFGADAASGWKITGVADWDDSCNWGTDGSAVEAEASSIQLVSAGSSSDIKAYSKRFYKFSFNTGSLVLSKVFGFDKVGVIGLNGEWNNGIDMTYNASRIRFYADITAESATEFKFWVDDAWDLNWGGSMDALAVNGDNIAIEAGSYRVYFYPNTLTCELNANMFGQEEPGAEGGDTPDPEPSPDVWSVIGAVAGTNWDTDFDFTGNADGTVWTYKGLTVTASDEFKLRKGHDWAESVGGPEANATSTIDETNPYDVYQPTLGEPFATGSLNIMIGVEGTYDITYDTVAGTILVTESSASVWSVIGTVGGTSWDTDFDLTSNEDGTVWTYSGLTVTASDEFKLRKGHDWAESVGGPEANATSTIDETNPYDVYQPTLGEPFATGSLNIMIGVEGTYDITYDTVAGTILIAATPVPGWSIIGAVAGTNWDTDFDMTNTEGSTWVYEGLEVGENDSFKLRYDHGWDVNLGLPAGEAYAGEPFTGAQNGDNIWIGVAGTYNVTLDAETNLITITLAE